MTRMTRRCLVSSLLLTLLLALPPVTHAEDWVASIDESQGLPQLTRGGNLAMQAKFKFFAADWKWANFDSGAFKAVAGMQAPGVYTTSAPALAKPGRHAMTVSVEAGDKADLLDVTLETPAAGMGEETAGHDHHGGLALGPWAWALAAAALLAVAVVLGLRTRSRSGPGSRASDKAGS